MNSEIARKIKVPNTYQGFLTQDLLQDLATVIVSVLEKVLHWNTDAFPEREDSQTKWTQGQ